MCSRRSVSILVLAVAIGAWAGVVSAADTQTVGLATAEEFQSRDQWIKTQLLGAQPPLSFVFGEQASARLLAEWPKKADTQQIDPQRTRHTLTWTDPKTGLEVRCVAVVYRDSPTVEWTVHFKNTGRTDTPILADVQALDVRLDGPAGASDKQPVFRLHHNVGSPCRPNDYEPLETALAPGTEKRITAAGGRPTNSDLPYFNLERPGGKGLIVVVGWPGQWAATFACDKDGRLRIRAGQELTHFKLLPGEEVRTPLIVLQFWTGDRVRSQNVWRRWMLAHNMPRPGGKLPPAQLAGCSSHQFGEMVNANTESQKLFIDRYLEEGLNLDYWWMDAGWYWNKTGWPNTGTWEVDTKRFPGGLRPISDHAHAKGVKTIVWFEPERVTAGTWLADNHPEWILGGRAGGLLNLGNPEARVWLTDHVDRLITEQGIDLYRQDFNMDPLALWRANDAPDRQGITEIKHVTGYLAYWDELRRRHPDMLIDSCASGGRRNDLETLRRAVPLLRSDYIIEPVGNQGHTYGIASWIPYYGTGTGAMDAYGVRSVMCPGFIACFDMRRKDLNYAEARRLLGQWRQVARHFFGDYYPLTPYHLEHAEWIAWQFNSPASGDGLVQAFRHEKSADETVTLRLHGLDPEAVYTVRDLDAADSTEMRGKTLLDKGLPITIKQQPGAALIVYKKEVP